MILKKVYKIFTAEKLEQKILQSPEVLTDTPTGNHKFQWSIFIAAAQMQSKLFKTFMMFKLRTSK